MVEQQIAAYKEQQLQLRFQMQPELIPGEKSHHLLTPGHDECENDDDQGKEDHVDDVGGVINISSIYQNEKSNGQFENAAGKEFDDESPDKIKTDSEPQHHSQQIIPSCIPFPIPKPRRTSIMIENSNYLSFDGNETWNSHDYATIGGSSNSSTTSGSTSTYAACGSFFPNSNLLQNHHERQGSSDSSAYSVLNECENVVNHHHHQCHHGHDHKAAEYEEISTKGFGDNDYHNDNNNDDYEDEDDDETQQEESVIIQSSGSTTGGAGIAFSTPIHPRSRRPQQLLLNGHAKSRMMLGKNSNYSQCSSITANSFLSKSSFCSSAVSAVSNPSISSRRKYRTPRKVVRKPPVNTPFSDKGEVLIRCYRNGDYVTVHVVQAKNLQICYRSSWKLSMKISLIPEGEATFTKSESVLVPRGRRFVRIDQKFSFENPQKRKSHHHDHTGSNCSGGAAKTLDGSRREQRKLFLTFVKRIEK
ncbi:hypothetical protein Ocin01_00240 [Orchesella cincta]|uniref:Uncharacterized protein n=1 Tax=Orchesella cincta TaxID=48709 RepID=A0A1D2NMD4_ORCCI|nr:hypothetical protein Ocin01_00240 [Orchesella cincta]